MKTTIANVKWLKEFLSDKLDNDIICITTDGHKINGCVDTIYLTGPASEYFKKTCAENGHRFLDDVENVIILSSEIPKNEQ